MLLHGDPLPPPIILPLLLCRSGGSVARPPPSPPSLASTCSWRPHDASMPRCLRLRPQPHASDFFLISPAFVRTTRAPSPFCPLALALGLASYAVHTTNCRMPGRDLIGTVSETTRGCGARWERREGREGGAAELRATLQWEVAPWPSTVVSVRGLGHSRFRPWLLPWRFKETGRSGLARPAHGLAKRPLGSLVSGPK